MTLTLPVPYPQDWRLNLKIHCPQAPCWAHVGHSDMNLESLNYEIAANWSTSNSMAFKSKISAKHDINGIFNFIFKDIPENLLKFW